MRSPFDYAVPGSLSTVPRKPSQSSGTQQVVNKTELPGWVSDAGQKNLDQAYQVSQNLLGPFTGQRVAGMTPQQSAAIAGLGMLPGMSLPAFNLAEDTAAGVSGFQPGGITPSF